jgi:hypothetical protein
MTIELHQSSTHGTGFNPNCPRCIKDEGIDGIIDHLAKCIKQNTIDGDANALAIAAEQRRMSAVLKLYRMHVVRS